jgi:hypothetical protein
MVHEEDISRSEFRRRLVTDVDPHRPEVGPDGFYGVNDVVSHSYLGPQCEIVIPLAFPFEFRYLVLFLQFRDIAGRNYSRLASFYPSETLADDSRWGTSSSFHGGRLHETERIDSLGQLRKQRSGYRGLPASFEAEFSSMFANGVFVGLMEGVEASIEDRGTVRELRS